MRSFRRTLTFLKPYRARVALAVVLTLLVTLLQIVPPRMYQFALDKAIRPAFAAGGEMRRLEPHLDKAAPEAIARYESLKREREERAPSTLALVAAGLVLAVVFRNLLSFLNSATLARIGHRFVFDLRFATWRHLHRLSIAFHNRTQVGKIMARVTADIELIQGLIQGQLVTFVSDLVTLVAVIGMLFFLEWRLALMIVGLIPCYVFSYLFFLRHIREVSGEQRRLYDEMLGKLAEKISGISVVKAFVRERHERESVMSTVREKFTVDMRQVHLNRRLGLVSGAVSALGTGTLYAYGGALVQNGEMTPGELVAMTFYIGFVFNPAVRVVDFNNTLQWALSAMDRVFETLDTRPEIEDRPNALPLPDVRGDVTFHGVTFGYGRENAAVSKIDLTVHAGEVVALVGPSGAGKTTLMNLLMRFYDPEGGRILVDGYDLREVRLESLRREVSMVAQENVLFSVSILENVRYGKRDATAAEVVRACRAADLHDFIESLPDGYETLIGEDGIKLSGGQKQRLALARALITDPKVLILDDVTSALDGETEARVQDSLRRVMHGRTTFIIAHRLSSVIEADRIVVLEEGRIVDIGTHGDLAERPGMYREMYEEQFRSVLAAPVG